MPLDRDEEEERAARIDALLQEARHKLAAIRNRRKDAKTDKAERDRQAKAPLHDDASTRRRPGKKSA